LNDHFLPKFVHVVVVILPLLDCANAPGMDDKCEAMARLGHCDTDRSLLDTCKLSCTRCAPLPSNITGMLLDFDICRVPRKFAFQCCLSTVQSLATNTLKMAN